VLVFSCIFILFCTSLQKESKRFYSKHEGELIVIVDANLITMEKPLGRHGW
jgi:hypothetical protein